MLTTITIQHISSWTMTRLTQQLNTGPRIDGRLHADFHRRQLQHSLTISKRAGRGVLAFKQISRSWSWSEEFASQTWPNVEGVLQRKRDVDHTAANAMQVALLDKHAMQTIRTFRSIKLFVFLCVCAMIYASGHPKVW